MTMTTFQWTVPAGLPAAGAIRNCFIMTPASPKASRRAVFYQWCNYAGFGVWNIPEPTDGNSLLFCQLGLFVVGIDQTIAGGVTGGSYGAYRSEVPAFMSYVHATFGVALQPSAFLRSRGGFWGNLAFDMPGFFDRLLGVGNITDGVSYDPSGIARSYTGEADPPAQTDYNAVPSVACPTLPTAAGNAQSLKQQNAMNSQAAALASSHVPMMFGYGTADTVVVPANNVLAFATAYASAGGSHLHLFPVTGGSHADITINVYPPLINFMIADNPEQTMTLPLYCKGALQVAQNIPVGTMTQLGMGPLDDPSGMINGSNQAVIPTGGAGLWQFTTAMQFSAPFPNSTDFWLAIRKNGTTIMKIQQTTSGATGNSAHGIDAIPVSTRFPCLDGDVIDVLVYIFSGTGPYAVTVNTNTTSFEAVRFAA